ncbi:hypothetical protein RSP822_10605 [Ralstonia solanacearum]|nr:hypothetical protein RSP822_10605 [Ralstonia solanacearum]
MTQDPGGADLLRRFAGRRVRIQSALASRPCLRYCISLGKLILFLPGWRFDHRWLTIQSITQSIQ